MNHSRRRAVSGTTVGLIWLAATLAWTLATPSPVNAQVAPLAPPSASDPRATFVAGNVSLCAAAGFPLTTQVGAHGTSSGGDANVNGTVATNAGAIQPGVGEEVNVTITGADVVIDAVVVKGGHGYNVYSAPVGAAAGPARTAALHLAPERWRQRAGHQPLVHLLPPRRPRRRPAR